MKPIIVIVLTFAFSAQMMAQKYHPGFVERAWYLSELTRDGNTFLADDYNASPRFIVADASQNDFAFNVSSPTHLCAFENVQFENDPIFTFEIPSSAGNCAQEPPCADPDPSSLCSQIHSQHYAFIVSSFNTPVEYEVIDNGDGTLALFLTKTNGDTALYYDYLLGNGDFPISTIALSPNPVKDVLYISSEMSQIETLSVYDTRGSNVLDARKFTGILDVSTLKRGVYFLELLSDQDRVIKKFVKD